MKWLDYLFGECEFVRTTREHAEAWERIARAYGLKPSRELPEDKERRKTGAPDER